MAPVMSSSADYGELILIVSWIEACLGFLFLSARFYSVWKILGRIRSDFYIALATFLIAFTGQIFLTISIHHGLGQHISTLSSSEKHVTLENSWIFQMMAVATMATGKCAVIAYMTNLRGPHSPRPWFLWFIGGTTVVANAITIALILAQCSPVEKLWDDKIPGTCNGLELNQKFAFFSGAWSCFGDATLALYPITLIWNLQMKLKLKLGLCLLMGVGLITAVCSAIRTSELAALSQVKDITFFISPLIIWTSTEVWVILILGCVPPIRPLFLHLFRNTLSQATSSFKSKYGMGTHYGMGTGSGKPIALSSVSNDEARTGNTAEIYVGKGSESREYIIDRSTYPMDGVMVTTNIEVQTDRYKQSAEVNRSGDSVDSRSFYKP